MTIQKDISKETLDGWANTTEKLKDDKADVFSDEALTLKKKRRPKEALTLINLAIERDEENPQYYNIKGLILKDLHNYRDSRNAFDRSLELKQSDEVLINKIDMLHAWANSLNDKQKALELINEAIDNAAYITSDIDMEKFWYLKGSILDCLGEKIESKKCYMIAEKMTDEIARLDEQAEYIKTTQDTLICITGTQFYFGPEVLEEGMTVDLVRDEENEHDSDAIRVEIEGETVGFVANSPHTMVEGVKSASQIKEIQFDKAEIKFLYLYEYVIAKLI